MSEWTEQIIYNVQHTPVGVWWFFGLLALAIYIFGICMSISDSTSDSSWEYLSYKGSYGMRTWHNDATPKDMWLALAWPFRLINMIVWGALDCVNSLLQYPLLLVGVKYKDSNLDRKIRMYLEGKY